VKKLALILFLISSGSLFFLTQKVDQTKEEDLQLGYQKFVTNQPGWRIEIFDNLEFKGFPAETQTIQKCDLMAPAFVPFQKESISAYVTGFLKVPQSGKVSLELASDDGALLYIDGKKVINNWGFHTFSARKEKIYLSRGWHYVKIKYRNRVGGAGLKCAWALEGEERHPMGSGEIFLAKNLILNENPFPSIKAQELVTLNLIRFCFLIGIGLGLFLFFWGKRAIAFWGSAQAWSALSVLGVAFALRAIYYLDHLQMRIQGIMDGGDNFYFLTLPLRFATSGEFISFKCGNLPILIPLLGTIYKYFSFFPGLHYFSLLMIGLTSLVCLFPWLLLRRTPFGWVGLIPGLLLALNPLLVEWNFPYVSSDPIGLFTFSLALVLSVKALQDNKWSSFIFASLALSLLPLTRTVYIPSAPLFMLALVVLAKKRGRALTGMLLFLSVVLGYEALARSALHEPYFLYFFRDGFGATVVHRAGDQPQGLMSLILWFPQFLGKYCQLLFDNLLPQVIHWEWLKWGVAGLVGWSAVVFAWRAPRLFFFVAFVSGIYLFEISSYHLHERLTLPIVFVIGLVFALGLVEGIRNVSIKKVVKVASSCALILTGLGVLNVGVKAAQHVEAKKKQNEFLKWVKAKAPSKSILLTNYHTDPWVLLEQTGLPVFFEATLDQTLVVNRGTVPINRVRFLAEQSQIPNLIEPSKKATFFRHHPYVLDGLTHLGYRYLIVQEDFAQKLERHYFMNDVGMSINPKDYRLEKIKAYPKDKNKGIWELKRTKRPIKHASVWNPPKIPSDLDRFLTKNR